MKLVSNLISAVVHFEEVAQYAYQSEISIKVVAHFKAFIAILLKVFAFFLDLEILRLRILEHVLDWYIVLGLLKLLRIIWFHY